MSFISYAQNYEDVMLWRALKHVKNGFYIDVGAAWPDEHSVTRAFYENGWHGINIEPNPVHHASLMQQRPQDANLQLAVGDQAGQLTMNFVGDTGLSTAIDAFAEQHQAAGWTSQKQEVELTTLQAICKKHVKPEQAIHFLKVDVEGLEEAALRGNDWAAYRPWVVVLEATLPMTQIESYDGWEPILLANAYIFAYADGLNRFYVANEHSELREAFKYPPNVFDSFQLSSQQKAHVQVQQAEAKAQQAEAKAQQAEAKAQQAEAKAEQAENASAQHFSHLQSVYASKSWRITAPLRWAFTQAKRLRSEGLKSRIQAFIKKVLCKINHELLLRPALRQRVQHWSRKLGLHAQLKSLMTKAQGGPQSVHSSTQDLLKHPTNLKNLSPRARQIYIDLKQAIEQQQKEKH